MPRFRIPRLRRRPRAPAPPPPPPPAPPPPPPPAVPPPPAAEPAPPPAVESAPRGTRVRALGHTLAGGAAAVGRVPSAAASGLRRFWLSLSLRSRRRLALALGVVVVLLVIGFVAVPALPCEAPGGDVCPPSDDAIALVPDDALAYLHVNVDPGTDQYGKASDVASRVPTLTDQLTSRLLRRVPGPHGHGLDFARDIQPWFGGQAALAVIPAGERAGEEVQLLQISDTDGAKKFAASIATGTPQTSDYRDVPVTVDRRRLATAEVGGFLAIGRESGVRDAIDAQSGASGTGSLEEEPAADAALDALPDERLADAYLSPDGIDRLVGNPRGPLATLDAVIDPGASVGAAMALVASDSGIELDIRSELDEARAKAQPGFFAAFPSFDPSLTTSLPSDSLAYVGMAEPGKTLVSLIEQASADQPGLAAAVDSLVKRVKQLGKVDLEKDLLPALGDEAAFALQPGGVPYLEFLSSGIDAERAGKALASLQAPIVKALGPAPAFVEHNVGGVTAHSVKVSPTVDLTYAMAGSVLLVATDPAAVKQLTSEAGGLGDDDVFKEATSGLTSDVSLLGFLSLSGLLTLAEQAGLAEDPAYTTFAPELHKLSALGVSVRESSTELATDVRLIVTPQAPPSSPSSSEGKGKGGQD